MEYNNWFDRRIVSLHTHRLPILITSGVLILFVACGGDGPAPTLVPTLALPTVAAPTDVPPTTTLSRSLLPTVTPRVGPATRTPWPADTPTSVGGAASPPTPTPPGCDADTLQAYEAFVAQLRSVYASLESQEYTQDALLAAIPQMERLLTQTQDLPTPCDRAYWLRMTLSERIRAEISDLEKLAAKPNQTNPGDTIGMSPLIDDALAALRIQVQTALTPAAPTATATPVPFLCDCSGDLYDCDYFRSQAEAQSCFNYCLPRAGDVHGLDPDGDGVACPSLP
jgi:hypothetical protein